MLVFKKAELTEFKGANGFRNFYLMNELTLLFQRRKRCFEVWMFHYNIMHRYLTKVLLVFVLVSQGLIGSAHGHRKSDGIFRFHLYQEPHSLHPARLEAEESSYLFFNLFRGLYTFDGKGKLKATGAKSCVFESPRVVTCELRPSKWSDGSDVLAEDYVRGFRLLLQPESRSRESGILITLRNASEILKGTKPIESLGITAVNSKKIRFDLAEEDGDFLSRLTSSLLVPVKTDPKTSEFEKILTNGPYRIKSWKPQSKAVLEPNPYYVAGTKNRPIVEVLFINDESAALNLFDLGELDFLRRLPTSQIEAYKNKPGFFQVPLSRFDYIGMLKEQNLSLEMRKALSLSVDYQEFARLFHALGRPGCPSLPESWTKDFPCFKFDLKAAKTAFAKVPESERKQKLEFHFSQSGGDDLKRVAEWYQAQWKSHLGLEVEIRAIEQGSFTQELKKNPPPLFRRGLPLDRPTCLAALEVFSQASDQNFIHLKSERYEAILRELKRSRNPGERKKLCSDGIHILLDTFELIPQGRIHFSFLIGPEFEGYSINELNQLDLSNLHRAKK